MLKFALHRQGQNSHVYTRWHAMARRGLALVLPQCRAWLSPNRAERATFYQQAEESPPGPERPGFHPWRNPMNGSGHP